MDVPPYALIGERLHDGRAIAFLGAGASLAGRDEGSRWTRPDDPYLPSADELAAYLTRFSVESSELERAPLRDLARAAQHLEQEGGPQQLRDDLRQVFLPRHTPGALHRYLAACPANLLIMTTNYDTLIEQAFEEVGRDYESVVYDNGEDRTGGHEQTIWVWRSGEQAPRRSSPKTYELAGDVPTIHKMHGSVSPDPALDSYVITDDDYVRFLWRMTGNVAIPAAFAERVRRGCFLFLGYSLRDWNLRVLLYELAQRYRAGYQSWSIQRGALNVDRAFWLKRGVTIFDLDLEQFARQLPQQMGRQPPASQPRPAVGVPP